MEGATSFGLHYFSQGMCPNSAVLPSPITNLVAVEKQLGFSLFHGFLRFIGVFPCYYPRPTKKKCSRELINVKDT
jgi:hypothetical protein